MADLLLGDWGVNQPGPTYGEEEGVGPVGQNEEAGRESGVFFGVDKHRH